MAAMRQREQLDDRVLENEMTANLDRALSEGWAKVLQYVRGFRNPSYEVSSGCIQKFWQDSYPNGDPVTKWVRLTREEFLDEFRDLPYEARLKIHQSLKEGYAPPPEAVRWGDPRIPWDLFGY